MRLRASLVAGVMIAIATVTAMRASNAEVPRSDLPPMYVPAPGGLTLAVADIVDPDTFAKALDMRVESIAVYDNADGLFYVYIPGAPEAVNRESALRLTGRVPVLVRRHAEDGRGAAAGSLVALPLGQVPTDGTRATRSTSDATLAANGGGNGNGGVGNGNGRGNATPTATATPAPTLTATATSTATPSATAIATATPTPAPTATATPSPTPSGTTPVPGIGTSITLHPFEVVESNADVGLDMGSAFKPRAVRKPNGDYVGVTHANGGWQLRQRSAQGNWATLASGTTNGNQAALLHNQSNGELNVFAYSWENALQRVRVGGAQSVVPGAWGNTTHPYSGFAIDAAGSIVMTESLGAESGWPEDVFNWSLFDADDQQYAFNSDPTQRRWAYPTSFVNGNSVTVVTTRNPTYGALGWTAPSGNSGDYVWNGIRVLSTPDYVSQPTMSQFFFKEVAPNYPGEYVQCMAYDAYMDTRGDLHIIYSEVRGSSWRDRHAVIRNGNQVVKDVDWPLAANMSRITQDANGRFVALQVSGNTMRLVRGAPGDVDGTNFEPEIRWSLGQYRNASPQTAFHLARPASGSPRSMELQGQFLDGESADIVWFRVTLP